MEIKGIKYIGPIFDGSGYAKANRGNIMALHSLGVPITLAPISFENSLPGNDAESKLLSSLVDKDIEYNIVIMHCTPEFYSQLREEGKTNVAYTIWETSKLHPDWAPYINASADKVLVGSKWNVDIFKGAGVTIPIGVVPHGIDMSVFKDTEPYPINGVSDDTFVFYSIFQWQERKNPEALLKAYWHAFQDNEDVALVIKAHIGNYSDGEKARLKETILHLKKMSVYPNYPKLLLISDKLTEDEIHGLHARGDCYTSLDRGEGFGLCPFTAGACGNPIVVTGFGGTTEYAKRHNSALVDYQLTPVSGMPWSPWYLSDQLWAEADIVDGANKMRWMYENRHIEAKELGKKLKRDISENFSWEVIGNKLVKELEQL